MWMNVSDVINSWRFEWASQRRKDGLADEENNWVDYLNGLSISDVILNLQRHGDENI